MYCIVMSNMFLILWIVHSLKAPVTGYRVSHFDQLTGCAKFGMYSESVFVLLLLFLLCEQEWQM